MSGYVLLIGFYKRQNDLSYLKESFIKKYFRLTPLVLSSVILAIVVQNTIVLERNYLFVYMMQVLLTNLLV